MSTPQPGRLKGVGHTTPAPASTPDTLPAGVLSSRMAAIKAERVETAEVILKLEKLIIDTQNKLIRVETVLREIRPAWGKGQTWAQISEALGILR